jgi:hypothetical protein
MSIAKAFLMGAVKGGLKENNQRARRMEERMLALSDNNAAMARERATSKYEAEYTAASAEHSKLNSLRSAELVDSEGNYLPKYFDKVGYTEFQKPEVRKAYGNDYAAFRKEFDKMGDKKFISSYKTPDEITRDVGKTYESISTRQQVESSQPVLTGIDKLLMKGSQSGMTPRTPQEVPELAQASPMIAQVPSESQDYVSPDFDKNKGLDSLSPENHMKVYARDAEGGVDTSSVRSVFVNKADGKLYEATSKGALPFDGDWVDAKTFDTKAPTAAVKQEPLSNYRSDIDKELQTKFQGANTTLRLTKGIASLAGVETAAAISTIPSKISEFFGTEWASLKDEDSKQEFMKDKINSIISLDEGAKPETLTEISAALGAMESMKLALAYASVKMNRGSGRFSAQELNTQLALFKDRSLPFMLSSLNTTYKDAMISIKQDVKAMAAQASVNHLYHKGVPNQYSQVVGNLTTEPRQDTNGNWVVLIDEGSRETYGAKYIIVTPDGGVQYK